VSTVEGTVITLDAVVFLELALTAQSERLILDANVDIFSLDVRQVRFELQCFFRLEYVDRRRPWAVRPRFAHQPSDGILKEA
jgi:hypothetical protein